MLGDRAAIALALEESGNDANLVQVLRSTHVWIERLRSDTFSALSELTERVELHPGGIKLRLKLPLSSLKTTGGGPDHFSLVRFVPIELKRRGVEMKMVLEGDRTPTSVDLPLLRAVVRARKWSNDLLSGKIQSVDALAKREGLDRRSVRRLLRLGFLSPRILEAIAEGRQPPELTVIGLTRRLDLPLLWSGQERALGTWRRTATSTAD